MRSLPFTLASMLPAPYHDVVVDHHRHPRNFGALPGCTHAADGANPLCGDRLRVELRLHGGLIAALRFSGDACAIATASASIMSELVIGADAAGVAHLRSRLDAVLSGACEHDAVLGPANALAGLRDYASRRPCALLPWAAVQAALSGAAAATTEDAAPR